MHEKMIPPHPRRMIRHSLSPISHVGTTLIFSSSHSAPISPGGKDWFNPVYWGDGTDPKDVSQSGEPKLKWLGECGNLKATSDECFKFYKYHLPLPVDGAVGMGLLKMLDIADLIYGEFLNLLSIFILVSFRVQVGGDVGGRRSASAWESD